MFREVRDYKDRRACLVDDDTGIVEHEYRKVKTKTVVPVGHEYTIERDTTITKLKRVTAQRFEVEKLNSVA